MLTDFGVAKVVDDEMTQDLTGTSATVGTPEYMAPEQVVSKAVDHRANIYALGIVFFEMVTGRRPYEADTPMAVLVKHASAPLPRPKDLVPDLSDEVERVLLKALAKLPGDRYPDMGALAAALMRLTGGKLEDKFTSRPLTKLKKTLSTIEQAESYAMLDQGAPPRVPPRVTKAITPGSPKRPMPWAKVLAYAAGGIALALLVIGITSGWFTPKSAAPTPTSVPTTPTETNILTQDSEIDGMTMVYVPAG